MIRNSPAGLLPALPFTHERFEITNGSTEVICGTDPNRAGLIVSVQLTYQPGYQGYAHVYPTAFGTGGYGIILSQYQNYLVATFRDWGPILREGWSAKMDLDLFAMSGFVDVISYQYKPKQLGDL
jgi:hypothetical protein